MSKPKKIDLDPYDHREEWLSWRRCHIGGTDSAPLLNFSPFKSAYQVYEEKIFGKETEINAAMQRGMELETYARDYLSEMIGEKLEPAVFESTEFNFMGASIDAINADRTKAYEIKCPGKKAMESALKGKIPEIYRIQVNKQMLVLDLPIMWLFFYESDETNIIIPVSRDPELIEQIIEADKKFWFENILKGVPPKMTNKDFIQNDNEFENQLALKWAEMKAEADSLAKAVKALETQLKELADGKSVHYTQARVKLTQVSRKGSVDWDQVCLKWNISEEEVEKYRKEKSSYAKISSEV